jgi:hypothetical protein
MSRHHFTDNVMPQGNLPPLTYGRLVAEFQFASHIPLAGGKDTGRHIYLALKVPSGSNAGLYECAFNIRSDEGTEVTFAERMENVDPAGTPNHGFQAGVKLAYGSGPADGNVDYIGLADGDFEQIENDELYQKISRLTTGCDKVAVYGVTYSPPKNDPRGKANGIHDVHMNSGTSSSDSHARDDRVHEDGALAFYFNLGDSKAFAHWMFIKFATQKVA